MDERKLDVLIAVAETGSFSKASQRCYCTQSAVTQLMNAIEAELGCKVVQRSHSGAKLTKAGEELVPLARDARQALRRLKAAADGASSPSGPVRIGAYASIANSWLPREIGGYASVDPKAAFEVRIGSSDLMDLVGKGDIDMALADEWLFETWAASAEGKHGRALRWVPLDKDPLCAVVAADIAGAPDGAIALQELFRHPYISGSKYIYSRRFEGEFPSVVSVNTDDDAPILSMVAAGMGVAILPALGLSNVPEGVAVLKLDPPVERTLGMALPEDAEGALAGFADYLAGEIGFSGSKE